MKTVSMTNIDDVVALAVTEGSWRALARSLSRLPSVEDRQMDVYQSMFGTPQMTTVAEQLAMEKHLT